MAGLIFTIAMLRSPALRPPLAQFADDADDEVDDEDFGDDDADHGDEADEEG